MKTRHRPTVKMWGYDVLVLIPVAGDMDVIGVRDEAVVAVAAALKLAYWHFIDTTAHPSTPESATGLGGLGKVRLFEGPHTEANYLMKEMGFRIARKHSRKLRRMAVATAFAAPLVLTLVAAAIPPGILLIACAALAAVSVSIGVLIERWLFFAEAKHVVILYYGGERA